MRKIAIYGSTGSVGKQTLEVIEEQGNFEVVSLCCFLSIDKLEEQIRKYKPKYAGVIDPTAAEKLRERVKDTGTIVVSGQKDSIDICVVKEVDLVVNSTVGISGLVPTLEFLKNGKNVALANKESLVTGGELVRRRADENHVNIYPIDSEHSAIWQCIQGNKDNKIERIIITASGGPFLRRPISTFDDITVKEALDHPTWRMGSRITIDSATLMNKGFEVIEAWRLFPVGIKDIEVVIHPGSIIHSAVQFADSSIIAQMGLPDMKLPIQYALNYPKRLKNDLERLPFNRLDLHTEPPDMERCICLPLAHKAMALGGTALTVLNGADEQAVQLFLANKIKFTAIPKLIDSALDAHTVVKSPSINEILRTDLWARLHVMTVCANKENAHLLRDGERVPMLTREKTKSV